MTGSHVESLERSVGRRPTALKVSLSGLFAILTFMVMSASPAQANLSAVGAVNPDNGFPIWYQDTGGTRLELCLDGPPNCLAAAGDLTPPDGEAFWFNAGADLTTSAGTSFIVMATEAAFAGAGADQQISFDRTRIRINVANPGTYTVTYPFGQNTYEVAQGDIGPAFEINDTVDTGCLAAPCDFGAAIGGSIGPFLTWDTLGAATGAPPAGFIGDAATPHKVVGSPLVDAQGNPQNYFKVQGPGIAPGGGNVLQTDLFTVQGKISGLAVFPSLPSGEYATPQSVTLTASDPAAGIFYTTDGTTPSPTSTEFTGTPIKIPATSTLKAMAVDTAGTRSPVATRRYTIRPATALSLSAKPSTVKIGGATTLSGALTSAGKPLSGKPVVLQQRPSGARAFNTVPGGRLTTSATGTFSLAGIKPTRNTDYRARFAGEPAGLKASTSPLRRVNVRVRVSMKVSAARVKLGKSVSVSGSVVPAHAGSVRLTITRDGALAGTKTLILSRSRFGFLFRRPKVGNYTVRASFASDKDHLGGVSPVGRFRVIR